MKFEVTSLAAELDKHPTLRAFLLQEIVDKFFAGTVDELGQDYYLRNDGKVFKHMQDSPLDLNGGTYFNTQQDAEDCLKRYNEQEKLKQLAKCN